MEGEGHTVVGEMLCPLSSQNKYTQECGKVAVTVQCFSMR